MASPAQVHSPAVLDSRDTAIDAAELSSLAAAAGKDTSIVTVLEYIRTTFCEDTVLDSIPLEAAANPGAYHAWRTYRAPVLVSQTSPTAESQASATGKVPESSTLGRNRRPGQWNWEGVWEERVKKAVKASLSEPVLFGAGAGEDIVCDTKLLMVWR